MTNYIDGFVFPISKNHLGEYKNVAEEIAKIWKEHGALDYFEYVNDTQKMEGTLSFSELANAKEGEVIVFGWVVFESKEARDIINKKVITDTRMNELVSPLVDPSKMIFNAKRMAYGGFEPLFK